MSGANFLFWHIGCWMIYSGPVLYRAVVDLDHFPLEKFLKKYRLLKKSCLFFNFKQLFFSNPYFLRNFFNIVLVWDPDTLIIDIAVF